MTTEKCSRRSLTSNHEPPPQLVTVAGFFNVQHWYNPLQMSAEDAKRLVNAGAIGVIILIVIVATVFFIRRARPTASHTPAAPLNYTRNICDDAYQSEHDYSRVNPPYFDIPLRDGCFSGFYHLPEKWQTWQLQFRQGQQGVWVSEWYAGWMNPAGPFGQAQVDAAVLPAGTVPSRQVRFEGKGILRIYRVTGDMNNIPIGQEMPKQNSK